MLDLAESTARDHKAWCVAAIAYEAAEAFLPVTLHQATGFPLLWVCVYRKAHPLQSLPTPTEPFKIDNLTLSQKFPEYKSSIDLIKSKIASGHTYQVNHTLRITGKFSGDAYALFHFLNQNQAECYGAFLELDGFTICSASPELFFEKTGRQIRSKPMKGTAPRGRNLQEDEIGKTALQNSAKDRAENVMIVDMIRNDIGKIADTGSVVVSELFQIETYPTVLQMTSTVEAQTSANITQAISALFPCASITGAPKLSTMRIINQTESQPRQIYCGSIGFIRPDGDAQFNVAIRTALVDKQRGTLEYGAGGGIVWDSTAEGEYAEANNKAAILTRSASPFTLKEALRWTPAEGYWLLHEHIQRLADSASYFGFQFDLTDVVKQLTEFALSLPANPHKVRLELSRDGSILLGAERITPPDPAHIIRLRLADNPINDRDPFYFHKTSRWQSLYPQRAQGLEVDFVYYNNRGEVTETSIGNLVFVKDGKAFTPPVASGLLDGTYRQALLAQGEIEERVIHVDEIDTFDEIWMINSVRGKIRAVLER